MSWSSQGRNGALGTPASILYRLPRKPVGTENVARTEIRDDKGVCAAVIAAARMVE